jgi:hypothetical protein
VGLEPATPCLQRRPRQTTANGNGPSRQIRPEVRMFANMCGRLRMVHKWSTAALALALWGLCGAADDSLLFLQVVCDVSNGCVRTC